MVVDVVHSILLYYFFLKQTIFDCDCDSWFTRIVSFEYAAKWENMDYENAYIYMHVDTFYFLDGCTECTGARTR